MCFGDERFDAVDRLQGAFFNGVGGQGDALDFQAREVCEL